MKSKWTWALLVALGGVAIYAGTVFATPSMGGQTTSTVAKSTFDSLNLSGSQIAMRGSSHPSIWLSWIKTVGQSDLYVIDNKFQPGATTGWHSHPGPSIIFVVAGTITNYSSDDPSCSPQVYSAGTGFVDPGGQDEHILRNEGSVVAETVAVQFLPKDATRRIDEPDPGNCHF
ncbi:MAG TPA: cupin domain-containing protein [Gaiellaceae bacterium]|nr:cupin domain-containing protein [Gaiellaceae bacterium]